jgi:hypothetical protein
MPYQVEDVLFPTMSGTELSRARTEPDRPRILAAIRPHPVQANRQSPPIATLAMLLCRRIARCT